jgi:hypothetical protein
MVFGLIGLVRLVVQWWYAAPVLYRWTRDLIEAALSKPPAVIDPPEPWPEDDDSDR